MGQASTPISPLTDDWFVDPDASLPLPFAAVPCEDDQTQESAGRLHLWTMRVVAGLALLCLPFAAVVVHGRLLDAFWCWGFASVLTYLFCVQGFVLALVAGSALCHRGERATRLVASGQRLTMRRLRNNRRLLQELDGRYRAVGMVRSLVLSSPLSAAGASAPRVDLFLIDHDGQTVDLDESTDELRIEKDGEWLAFMLDLPLVDGRHGQAMPLLTGTPARGAECCAEPEPAPPPPQVFEWDAEALAMYEEASVPLAPAPVGWAGSLLIHGVLVVIAAVAGGCLADALASVQTKGIAWGTGYLAALALVAAGHWQWRRVRHHDRQAEAVRIFGEPVDMWRLRRDAGLRRQLATAVREIGVEPSMDRPVAYTFGERFDPRCTTSYLITRDGVSCDLESGREGDAVAGRARWLADKLGVPLTDHRVLEPADIEW